MLLVPDTLKYWVGVQQDQSYLMGRSCLFSLGWWPFYWWCHNKNALWGRCFIAIGLVKTGSGFIVRSVETGLGRRMLVVAMSSVDAYLFFGFLRPDLLPWGYRNRCFLVALCRLIVRRPNLEVVTKRILHQQVKILG